MQEQLHGRVYKPHLVPKLTVTERRVMETEGGQHEVGSCLLATLALSASVLTVSEVS